MKTATSIKLARGAISRRCNFYARQSYKYRAQDSDCIDGYDVQSKLRGVDTLLDSEFYKNQPRFMRSLASMKLDFEEVWIDRMPFIVGPGGDSKGLVATLEKGLMGRGHSDTIGPTVFYEDAEFRTPPPLRQRKEERTLLRTSQGGGRFVGDLWKRFVVGGTCDLRSNFGQTTQVEFIGR